MIRYIDGSEPWLYKGRDAVDRGMCRNMSIGQGGRKRLDGDPRPEGSPTANG